MHFCHTEECITSICICCTVCLSFFSVSHIQLPMLAMHGVDNPIKDVERLGHTQNSLDAVQTTG